MAGASPAWIMELSTVLYITVVRSCLGTLRFKYSSAACSQESTGSHVLPRLFW